MGGMRLRMELEKKLSDFREILHRVNELMMYYPRDLTLPTIHDLLEGTIRTIEEELHNLEIKPTQESTSR